MDVGLESCTGVGTSDRLFGLTLGTAFAYESRQAFRERLARAGFVDLRDQDVGAFYPHAHVVFLARRPDSPSVRNSDAVERL